MSNENKVGVSFKLTQEFLEQRDITVENLEDDVKFLFKVFGKRFVEFFPNELDLQNTDFVLQAVKTYRKIQSCEGLERHILEYVKDQYTQNYFVAQVAGFLLDAGHNVELEPPMDSQSGPHPDIKANVDGKTVYVECKTSDIDRYYRLQDKQRIADFVYDRVQTCDNLSFYFDGQASLERIHHALDDDSIVRAIYGSYRPGQDGLETSFELAPDLRLNVMQKAAISGSEEDHLIGRLVVFIDDNMTHDRKLGYVFMRGGRSIAVLDDPGYDLKLKSKKEQSERQVISGYANLVFIDDTDVFGQEEVRSQYIREYWFPEVPDCSGVVMLGYYQHAGQAEPVSQIKLYMNDSAKCPLTINWKT